MATTQHAPATPDAVRSLIPARIDRLRWSSFHTKLVIALGLEDVASPLSSVRPSPHLSNVTGAPRPPAARTVPPT